MLETSRSVPSISEAVGVPPSLNYDIPSAKGKESDALAL